MDTKFGRDLHTEPAPGTGVVAKMTERVNEPATPAVAAVADAGRHAVEGIDAQRRPAAMRLDHTVSALHQQTDRVAGVAHSAADKLRATADYVRNHDLKAMAKDVEGLVRRYPGQALLAAAVMGFLVARVVRTRA